MMFQKSLGETQPLCSGSRTFASDTNQAGMERSAQVMQELISVQRKRNVVRGGMFNHNGRIYRHV